MPVLLLKVDNHFACEHCDSVCTEKNCLLCYRLHNAKEIEIDGDL
nr:MAG TPA: Transcriptional regulator Kaiso/DNA Complex methylation, Zinc finger, Transcriptional.66A [Caudoviricetes sp.]